MNPVLQDLLVATGLLAALMVALEVGYRAGLRISTEAEHSTGQVGAIQGAVLGLMGLLLAFSFAAAGSRFLERQDLITQEANAIGTAFLRADLLDEPHRTELRSVLQRYTEHRIEVSSHLRNAINAADLEEIERLHARMWRAAMDGVAAKPGVMLGVLPPVNDVIDTHSLRLAAGRKHIPALVMGLLIACAMLSVGDIGYGCGMNGRRRLPLTGSLALVIGAALWITIDLDHARAGLMQLSDAPLKAIKFDEPAR